MPLFFIGCNQRFFLSRGFVEGSDWQEICTFKCRKGKWVRMIFTCEANRPKMFSVGPRKISRLRNSCLSSEFLEVV